MRRERLIMDNFSPNRRNVVDITDLNKFLTKMYGLMTLAVLLSALTAWLVMTVFAQQFTAFMVNNRWGMWLIILLPIILTLGINFNATRSPGLCELTPFAFCCRNVVAEARPQLMLLNILIGFAE